MLRPIIKELLLDQHKYFKSDSTHITREIEKDIQLNLPFAVILTGVRRSGKSTLLKQLISKKSGNKIGYVHFDDPRLIEFTVNDFYTIEKIWPKLTQFQFDEIQNINHWEKYIRQGLERKLHFAITGSNAKLLSKELGTLLTGRHISHEIFPFSYREFCTYKKLPTSQISFKAYMAIGGFPEFVAHETKKYHQELFKDIVYRDIAVRNKIRNVQELTIIALHLINNMARPFTFNKLAKNYEIKSVNTVTNFVRFLEDSYLLFPLQRFDFSYKKQQVNEKKIYVIDHVLALQNSTQMHDDYGRILENMVFLEIRRKTKSVWYFKNKGETDFIYQWKGAYHAVQVCWELSAENNKREINGLKEAMESIDLISSTIVTANQEDEDISVLDKTIKCIPFWKWEFPE